MCRNAHLNEKVPLNVLGITYNRAQPETYILIMIEEGGVRQMPIAIRLAEAQSIMAFIQRVVPRRPLTHDLFSSLTKAFGIELQEVFIYHYEEGIFSTEMIFNDGEREVHIDARASDAVALAMRMHAPIFTTRSVLDVAGITPDPIEISKDESADDSPAIPLKHFTIESYSTAELKQRLQQAIDKEEYEMASRIQQELKRREANDSPLA